jgi:leucyl-tRNA synthetase
MSKSLGNTVDPLDVIKQGYGADSLRTFELFLGPIEENSNWSSTGIAGVYRFLNRAWTLVQEFDESDKSFTGHDSEVLRLRHKTARKVTDDIRRLSFNTAISALMEYVNDLYKLKVDGFSQDAWHEALSVLAQLVSPFAPHMAEELWQQLGHEGLIQQTMWPSWDDTQIIEDVITVVVQVNGKLRGKLEVPREVPQAEIEKRAFENENVQAFVEGKQPKKIIYIPGKLLNIVV